MPVPLSDGVGDWVMKLCTNPTSWKQQALGGPRPKLANQLAGEPYVWGSRGMAYFRKAWRLILKHVLLRAMR